MTRGTRRKVRDSLPFASSSRFLVGRPDSSALTSQAASISRAMERRRAILSGSKMRREKGSKKRGVMTTAASQPASISLSQKTLNLVCKFYLCQNVRFSKG